jgi:hypothetical protein
MRDLAMLKTLLVCAGMLFPGVWVAGAGAAGDGAFMPADQAVAGWVRTGPQKVFTQADLYGYIDGGAELFLEFGFESLTLQRYRNGADEIAVEVYRMADLPAGLGIYLMKGGRDIRTRDLPYRHIADRYQVMLQQGRYLLLVNRLKGEGDLTAVLNRFAARVAGNLPAETPRPLLRALPEKGLVPDSARLIRGPYALGSVYTLGEGDILSLQDNKVVAVSGRYREAGGAETALLVAEYPSDAAAGAAYRRLADNLDPYLEVEQRGPAGFIFKDYAGKYGAVAWQGRRLTLRLLLPSKPAKP